MKSLTSMRVYVFFHIFQNEIDTRKGTFYYDPVIRLEAKLTELRQNISHLGTKLSNFPQIRVMKEKDVIKSCDQNVLKPQKSAQDPMYSMTRQKTWTVPGSSPSPEMSHTYVKNSPENPEINIPKVIIPPTFENQREQVKLHDKLSMLEKERQATYTQLQNEQNKVALDLYKKIKKSGDVSNASKQGEQCQDLKPASKNPSPQRSRRQSDCFPSISSKSVLNVKVKDVRSRSPTPLPKFNTIMVPTMTDVLDTSDAEETSEPKDDVTKSPSVDATRILSAAGCPVLPPIHRVSSGRVTFVPDSFEDEPPEYKQSQKKGNKTNKRRMSRRMSQTNFKKH